MAPGRLPDDSTAIPNPTWAAAGATIVNRTTRCGSVINAGASVATVNTAIANCPAGQYVELGAGSFSFAGSIAMKSNVTLRGAGPNTTFLTFTNSTGCTWQAVFCFGGSSNYFGGEQNTASWSAGYARGTTVITLSSNTNISVGTVLHLDELSDACSTAGNDLWPEAWRSQLAPRCSYGPGAGDANGGGTRAGRAHAQEVMVTAVQGGSCAPCSITITPALFSTFKGTTPQAVWPTTTGTGIGIEDLSIDVSSFTPERVFDTSNTSNSWIKHVRSIDPGRSNVNLSFTVFFTISDSYFFRTLSHSTVSYGLEFQGGCSNLIENNILQWISAPIVSNGGCGNVIAYNFAVNDQWDNNLSIMFAGGWAHNGGSEFNLYEGNDWPGVNFDIQHGSQHLFTLYRNYMWGRERGATDTTNAANVRSLNRFMSYLGNVMGTSGYHTVYKCDWGVSCADEPHSILSFGSGYGGTDGPVNDARVSQSAYLWGNWDVVTSTADNTSGDQTGTRWCGNSSNTGWTTRCSSTSEVPSAIGGSYQQSIPSTETLPPSLYRSSKPAFMKSSDPWPFYGPDVTHASPISNTGGHAAHNLAAQCYYNTMGGTSTGTTVLPFTCVYASTAGAPSAPTNVRIVP
jgi:hypothetical protein